MNLTAAERKLIRKLAAELDEDEGQDEGEPRARRAASGGRHRRPARVADRVDSDADVFVLRGPSADRFLASLGISGADEGQDDDEAEDEGQDDDEAEDEAPARQDPEPAARTHRYFR